ncbi:MAG: MBL fold metallo-hydrolase [Paramuribaculum sp.]|nr:MBL fold metallo-hydrolase [Paramuribaculum sp.]
MENKNAIKITAVVDNISNCGMSVEHGLCLWIEACKHRFFFDLGQSDLFAENAAKLGINVNEAEFAVISHGHYDHGGGIISFLKANNHVPVYIHKKAFGEYYSLKEDCHRYIGLHKSLYGNSRIVLIDGVKDISSGITVFEGCDGNDYFSPANRKILKKEPMGFKHDEFAHEQSVVISNGDKNILIAGCAHSGIVNIMRKAEAVTGKKLTHVISGMHLTGVSDEAFIDNLGKELLQHDCQYYTCHCTGESAYNKLKSCMGKRINYLSCGDSIVI